MTARRLASECAFAKSAASRAIGSGKIDRLAQRTMPLECRPLSVLTAHPPQSLVHHELVFWPLLRCFLRNPRNPCQNRLALHRWCF